MKRLYTVFLTAVVALVCSVAASAQNGPLNLTLNCDRDDAIEWRQTWSDADWKLLQKGDNAIVLDYDYGYNLHLRPVDGMRLDAVKSIDPDTYSDLEVYNPLDRSSFYPNASWEGRTYNLVTTDLSEVRTTKLTVNITDDPKRFTIRRNSGPAYTFPSAGEHEFALDPNAELPLYVVATGGTPLYKVELDGATIALDENSRTNYTINNVTDGSRLDVTANWPDDLETDVKITVPAEMAENLVRNFGRQVGYSTEYLDYQVNESFKVKSGYFYNLYFNTSEYSITSIKVNGVDQYVSSSTSFFAGTDPIEVVVEAIVKEVPKYTLRVARAGEVLYSTNGYSFGPLPEGDTEISPEETWGGWSQVYVKAVDGFRLKKIECAEAGDEIELPEDPSHYAALTPDLSWKGRVYTIETANLDDERTASVTITVTDSPSNIYSAKRGASRITLGAAGEPTTFKFNPETTESTFEFCGNLVPLCEVKVNGVSIPSDAFDSTIHTIQVKDGDAIELTGGYPDIEVPLTVNVPADAAGVVSLKRELEGYYNYEDIAFTANEPVMVPAGSCILVTFDSSYNLKSAMVGENPIARYDGKFFVLNEAVDLDIDAAPWKTLSFTLNADDPTKFKVYPGSSTYGAEPYELVAGANNLTIEERQGCFLIKPESGFQVNSVTDADGNPYTPSQSSSNVYDVTEDGMVFNIVSGEMTYDNTWVLWIDSADNISTETDPYWSSSEFRGEYNYISDIGYSVQHNYAKALDEQFSFFIPTIKGFYLYLNGEFSRMHSEYSANCYHFFTPLNKVDVFRLYTTGEPAEKYALTFVTSGNKAADAQVVTDLLVEQPAWAEGLELLEQTRVAITLPEDVADAVVKLDDTALTADEDGKYVFDTSADHVVTISASSSVIELGADNAEANKGVYNLLGVKVLDNASEADLSRLPAGVYIVNGQKRVVR